MLFDLEDDPEESKDIAAQHPDIVQVPLLRMKMSTWRVSSPPTTCFQDLLGEIEKIRSKMPASPRYWMVSPNWTEVSLLFSVSLNQPLDPRNSN